MTESELPPFADIDRRPAPTALPDPAMGRLVESAAWLADRLGRSELRRPVAVLICGDHDGSVRPEGPDSSDAGDSARGADLPGPASMTLTALAGPAGAVVVEHDVATTHATDTDVVVRRGHPHPAVGDAATPEQVLAAVEIGRGIADREIDSGADLLVPGLAGRGHAAVFGTLAVALCGIEPADVVWEPDPARWAHTVSGIRDAAFRVKGRDTDALSLLATVGGADVAVLAALIAQAAARRTPVLLDGLAATCAALLAHRLAPGAEDWFLAAGEAPDRVTRRFQEMLGLPVVAALGTSAASGAGSLLVLPLLRAALQR